MPTVPANRLIEIIPGWQQAYVWPVAQPDDDLDYSIDIAAVLEEINDTIASASVASAPSGTGELTIVSVAINGDVITSWLSGGVAGRTYCIDISVTTTGGRVFVFCVHLPISAILATNPIPLPPNPGYSSPVTA